MNSRMLRKGLINPSSRLNLLTLRILEAQPIVSHVMLDLLTQAIEDGSANLDASHASIQEIKKGWNLP